MRRISDRKKSSMGVPPHGRVYATLAATQGTLSFPAMTFPLQAVNCEFLSRQIEKARGTFGLLVTDSQAFDLGRLHLETSEAPSEKERDIESLEALAYRNAYEALVRALLVADSLDRSAQQHDCQWCKEFAVVAELAHSSESDLAAATHCLTADKSVR